jgi:cytochrome c5
MRPTPLFAGIAAIAIALPGLCAERSGEQIVKQQCAQCHESGKYGAPRISDRAAWTPRMQKGVDETVRAAIRGHGKMPVRGGLADVTDNELRAAILYMFNPAGVPQKPAPAPEAGPNQKIVDGTEIYLGVVAKGGDSHEINITLRDSKTHKTIDDALVEVKVTNPVMGAESKKLNPVKTGDVVSYGNDFRITGKEPHVITVQVRRPGGTRTLETKFDYRS